jgi:hypothetical protein
MLSKVVPGPTLSRRLQQSTIFLITRTMLGLTMVVAAAPMFVVAVHAQAPYRAIGSMGTVTSTSCTPGFDSLMTCFRSTVTCPNVSPNLGLTFGYEVDPTKTYNGTVVMLAGSGGTAPSTEPTELQFIQHYYAAGYEVIQLAWDDEWENSSDPPYPPGSYGNIQYAACRPATFLNYIYNTPLLFNRDLNHPHAGMCAQGKSAGSAAIAYALAWYGAGDPTTLSGGYLDNVELLAGPPLGDIYEGCEYPHDGAVTVCGPGMDWIDACTGWPGGGIPIPPVYADPARTGVREWTNIPQCGGTTTDTSTWNPIWRAESIVAPPVNLQQFTYPNTSMEAWLCASSKTPMNNTTPQGYYFYKR